MLADILPPSVVAVEAFADPAAGFLYPEERAVVAQAVTRRQREFATVRYCARRALAALGVAAGPLVPGERGAPQWPPGIVGSMTHCDGYRAAAAARKAVVRTVGIDAEPHAPLPDGVLPLVSLHGEREHLRALGDSRPDVHWDRLLFSAKESVYKAWFPLTGQWLGFEDAEVTIEPASATFSIRILKVAPTVDGLELDGLHGRWVIARGLVVTSVLAPAHGQGSTVDIAAVHACHDASR